MIKLSYAIPLLDDLSKEEIENYLKELSLMGYKGIEPALAYAEKVDADHLISSLKKYDMQIVACRSGGIMSKEPVRLTSPNAAVRERAIDLLKRQIDFMEKVGGNLVIGGIQGQLQAGESQSQAEQWLVDAFVELANYAEPKQVRISFEPINRYELGYHNSTLECLGFLDRINESVNNKVCVVFDVFHSMMEDISVPAAMINAMDRITHFHFSDSCRREPGSGNIRFDEIVSVIDALGFEGFVTFEIWPKMDHLTAAKVCADYISEIMKAVTLSKSINAYRY